MLKSFKWISAGILGSILAINVAYADVYIPKNQFKDPVKQFNYVYNIARNDNSTWANYKLATYYENGYGTKKDIIKSYAWYRMTISNAPEFEKDFDILKSHMSAKQISEGDKEYDKIVSDNLVELNKSVNETGFK